LRLSDLVETSRRVGATRSRGEKVAHLAECVRRLAESPALVAVGVPYLAGELPQGRIGVGYALLSELRAGAAAAESTLVLEEVDRIFTAIKAEAGVGSAKRRNARMASLLSRATAAEQEFLVRLVANGDRARWKV
jgi:DNA ligase-1